MITSVLGVKGLNVSASIHKSGLFTVICKCRVCVGVKTNRILCQGCRKLSCLQVSTERTSNKVIISKAVLSYLCG